MDSLILIIGRAALIWILIILAIWIVTSYLVDGLTYQLCAWITAMLCGTYILLITFAGERLETEKAV